MKKSNPKALIYERMIRNVLLKEAWIEVKDDAGTKKLYRTSSTTKFTLGKKEDNSENDLQKFLTTLGATEVQEKTGDVGFDEAVQVLTQTKGSMSKSAAIEMLEKLETILPQPTATGGSQQPPSFFRRTPKSMGDVMRTLLKCSDKEFLEIPKPAGGKGKEPGSGEAILCVLFDADTAPTVEPDFVSLGNPAIRFSVKSCINGQGARSGTGKSESSVCEEFIKKIYDEFQMNIPASQTASSFYKAVKERWAGLTDQNERKLYFEKKIDVNDKDTGLITLHEKVIKEIASSNGSLGIVRYSDEKGGWKFVKADSVNNEKFRIFRLLNKMNRVAFDVTGAQSVDFYDTINQLGEEYNAEREKIYGKDTTATPLPTEKAPLNNADLKSESVVRVMQFVREVLKSQ